MNGVHDLKSHETRPNRPRGQPRKKCMVAQAAGCDTDMILGEQPCPAQALRRNPLPDRFRVRSRRWLRRGEVDRGEQLQADGRTEPGVRYPR